MKQYEVTVPFIGYCSVLTYAETPEQAIASALRLNSYELMKGNDNSGGIGRIEPKMVVSSGPLAFVAGAKEVDGRR